MIENESTTARSEGLTARDAAIIEFERAWLQHSGAKAAAICAQFGLTQARYYQMVNTLIDSPVALASDPLFVYRLRRLREKALARRE